MKHTQKLLTLVVALTFICLFTLQVAASPAFAKSVSATSLSMNTAALQKIRPDGVYIASCPSFADFYYYHNGLTQETCFGGTGYGLPGGPYFQVNTVAANDNLWIRWYQGGPGHFCSLPAGDAKGWGSGQTNVEITQLDLGTLGGYPHC